MSSRPSSLTGGCLCGAIRYSLKISENDEWPTKTIGDCQCTMCRKSCGSLVSWLWTIRISQIEPPLSSSSSYKVFDSSSTAFRSFCSSCGCSLTFNYKDTPEETHLYMGTLDEECLIGAKVPGSEKQTEYGVAFERHGGIEKEAFGFGNHYYLENAIPGITDQTPDLKHLKTSKEGKGFV